jgi:succinate dehydrogenase / fumarate reductase cytochrome b subunit
MSPGSRPLSPHLQIYKPQITSVLSILHRFTGVALVGGVLLLVWWLIAAAAGPDAFVTVQSVMGSWIGRLVLFGFTFSLFYHLCNGIRHIVWDAGYGYGLPAAAASGWTVVAASVILTVAAWVAGYAAMGGA